MAIITLTTDIGYKDPYLAIVKANLYSKVPNSTIIDLSSDVQHHNISEAAFILKQSLPHFPENTIHLIGVKFNGKIKSNQKFDNVDNNRYLVTYYKQQYIICPDNGFLTLLDDSFNDPVYQLYFENTQQHAFFLKDIFIPAAQAIIAQKSLSDIAIEATDYHRVYQFSAFSSPGNLKGKSLYIDEFGNIITNINKELFHTTVQKKSFSITLPGKRITELSSTYDDVELGEPLAFFNSFGLLEIAINGGSAYKLLYPRHIGQHYEFQLTIEFDD